MGCYRIRNMRPIFLPCVLLVCISGFAQAHGTGHAKQSSPPIDIQLETAYGKAGDRKKLSRTIIVDMSDAMRFSPSQINVKQNQTIRFVIRNKGKILHEMVIGTARDIEEHAALMKKFPDMEHSAPNLAHVEPGESEEIVWQFTKPGEFTFACLVAGHFEAGMTGKISVIP